MCEHPIVIKNSKTSQQMLVPCGQCFSCRLSRCSEWSLRLCHEKEYNNDSCFITLTYDDAHIHPDLQLHKEDLQSFLKAIKQAVGYGKLKYFTCGEYGGQFGRPHFHGILFGADRALGTALCRKFWKNGFSMVQDAHPKAMRYVAGYVCDKLTKKNWQKKFGDRIPQFQLCSKGLGLKWALAHKEQIFKNMSIKVGQKERNIPRYYIKKLFPQDTEIGQDFRFNCGRKRYGKLLDFAQRHGISQKDVDDYFYCRGQIFDNIIFKTKMMMNDVAVNNIITQRNLRKKQYSEPISQKDFTDSVMTHSEYIDMCKTIPDKINQLISQMSA